MVLSRWTETFDLSGIAAVLLQFHAIPGKEFGGVVELGQTVLYQRVICSFS